MDRRPVITVDQYRCPLSFHRLEICQMVAEGLSNKQIAQALGISPYTIKSHLSHISDILGANNRAHIVYLLMRDGWLE